MHAAAAETSQRLNYSTCRFQALKVVFCEDPATFAAVADVLLLHEQARSAAELASTYAHALGELAAAGASFGAALQRLAVKNDPKVEKLWDRGLSLEGLLSKAGGGAGGGGSPQRGSSAAVVSEEFTPGCSTTQALLHTLGAAQAASHARLADVATHAHAALLKAEEQLKEAYRVSLREEVAAYAEAKRKWRYSLQQAVAHRLQPEEASKFEAEAAVYHAKWEAASPGLAAAARAVKAEHAPRLTRAVACYVQAQLKGVSRAGASLQREAYKRIDIAAPST